MLLGDRDQVLTTSVIFENNFSEAEDTNSTLQTKNGTPNS